MSKNVLAMASMVFLLLFSLCAQSAMAQSLSRSGKIERPAPRLPNSQNCDVVESTYGPGVLIPERLSRACIAFTGKTFASSEYTDWPSGWDSLTHTACVSTTHDTDGFQGSGCQTKYQTSGLACPIVWVANSGFVTTSGTHTYEIDLTGIEVTATTRIYSYTGGTGGM